MGNGWWQQSSFSTILVLRIALPVNEVECEAMTSEGIENGRPGVIAKLDEELDRSNIVLVRMLELTLGSPSFRPHFSWVN